GRAASSAGASRRRYGTGATTRGSAPSSTPAHGPREMATTATNHWKLGLFVLLAVVALLGALFWLGARRFHRESFAAVSYFDESVQGLDVGSPVKFRGVTVGTVAEITIAPDHRHVQVTSNIYLAARVDKAIDEAKLGATTASMRDASASVGLAAAGVGEAREELQASLVALREALESVRTLADSLERDPSALLRGPRTDGAVPVKGR